MNPLLLLRPHWYSLGIVFCLLFSSLTAQNLPKFSPPFSVPAPAYLEFIHAAQAWELPEMERLAKTQTEKAYLKLFKAVQLEDHEAIADLGSSWTDRPGSRLRSMAITMARHSLALEASPELLARVGPEDPDYAMDLAMSRAFAHGPPEELAWQENGFALPIDLNSSNNALAEVKLNGKTYRFWLDTGAGMSVISEKVRKACKIPILESSSQFQAGTGTQKMVGFRPGNVESLELGGLTVKNHRVLVLKTSDLQMRILGIPLVKIDGIIGWPLLKQMDLEFDFPNAQLKVRRPQMGANPRGGLGWMGSPFVPCQLSNGKRLNLMLDTGASETFFYQASLSPLGLTSVGNSRTLRGSAGGKELSKTDVLRGTAFLFSGKQVTLSYAEAFPKDADSFPPVVLHGVMGQDILAQGVLRIDWSNRHLSFAVTKKDEE